ncbi:MAG: molybdopterin-dependent oxidoreductase [Desulfobacterales bacterium]|nr:molybdopterin-dependent oxidoreductase [Desulfobacterales bacterium]
MAEKVFFNGCPAAGCHQNCALKVRVRDGKIFKIESAEYPGEPTARVACLKGLASMRLVYHPDRLKFPLKRAGKRGEGKWTRISWDEAFDSIAGKLLKIKEIYGPQAVMVKEGGSSSVGTLMGRALGRRFASAWGAGGSFDTKGHFSDGGVPAASLMIFGTSGQSHDVQDYVHSKMLILWGGNPAETSFRQMKYFLDARDAGAKLVVIGPLFDATAAKADQWVPIRSGTDAALALGMMNVMITRGLFDKDYVAQHTVGPFLVRADDKHFMRRDGKYAVWDEKTGQPGNHDAVSNPALYGDFTIEGVRCKPAFELLAQRAAQYPPDKSAGITGVPPETIIKLAKEYATSKPAAIKMFHGMARTIHGSMGCRAIMVMAAMAGNIGIHGGGASTPMTPSLPLNAKAVGSPPGAPGKRGMPGSKSAFRGWAMVRDENPYPVKALLGAYRNEMQSYGSMAGYQDIYSRMELVSVSDIFMTRTAQNADIVLPEASIFERDDIMVSHNHVLRMEKAIEPLYECKSALDIWSGIARRVGLAKYFDHSLEDYMRMLLDTRHPSLAGITLERLEQEKLVRADVPLVRDVPFADQKFPAPSGRIELYQERLLAFGEELPLHKEPLESPRSSPLAQKYPLSFFSVKGRTTTQSVLANIDWMQEVEDKALLDMNPVDADARGIKDDDPVVVFNDRGKAKLKARLNQTVPPGAVNTDHGPWPEHFLAGHYNDLLHRVDDLNNINPAMEIEPVVSDTRGACHQIVYDCLVEVAKA